MRRHLLLALAPLMTLATGAFAAAPKSEGKKADVGQYVDLQPVGLPVIADGWLVNYVFVNIRIVLNNSASAAKWREKEPYFRDALVRSAHRTPFTKADDYSVVDVGKLTHALMRDSGAITGPGVVRNIVVTAQAPKRRLAGPRPR